MSAITPNPLTTTLDVKDDVLFQRGLAIYDEILKPALEPAFNGQYIAIHVASGEYAVAKSSGDTRRAMRKRQPEGPLVILQIGPEPEWGLAGRFLAGQMAAGSQK
jgi:hypothetical protein